MRIGHTNFNPSVIGVGATVGLGALGLALVYPITGIGVHAEEAEIKPFSAAVQTNVSTYVRSSIAVSLAGEVEVDLNPTSKGTFSESSGVDLSVTTNNTSGYAVYLATGDNSGALIQRSPAGGEGRIAPVQGSMTAANYTSHLDSWGYNIANGENTSASVATASGVYAPIPGSSSSPVIQTNSTSSDDSYTLRFGVAISPSLPAGVYNNTVVASVVANPIEVRSLTDLTTMQEMTPEICEISYDGEAKALVDSRNGKSYTIFKAKDGNCWMRDNLAIDGTVPIANVTGGTSGEYELEMGENYWTKDNMENPDSYKDSYGFYYSYFSATAGTGVGLEGSIQNASGSICPTGGNATANWMLPKAGDEGAVKEDVLGGFMYLFAQYNGSQFDDIVSNSELLFQPSGYYSTRSNLLLEGGKIVYLKTRTASTDILKTFTLYVNNVGSRGYVNEDLRTGSWPARCLFPSTSTRETVQRQ